ncbi:flavin reductase family protein [Vagococcus elongatus]|uniref:Conserved protein/domain typically associated with flavoprotein oxygenase, DIM6/NTAB family n=1 Tax=Vagococcus elongatus TaxID=180344 RepID=A0A430AQS4_9ENTE|nr:flavin reductase family protein [Vagococcus elongatus]RSU10490.1 conserved protein/domain typically associated with flavoprotein oxygenase, DIM6/NTAB family [Vagococcus elongatus]
MKQKIQIWDHAEEILSAVSKGVLLTTKSKDKVNAMTISWGTLGIEWSKPIFTVFVRENRFTRQLLEENGEFTINIPMENFDKKILGICGKKTGRNTDKIEEAKLTLVESEKISVPAIRELPLTLECRVIYKQKQDPEAITEDNKNKYYPQDVDSSFHGSNRDYHTAYYGEILDAYIIQ